MIEDEVQQAIIPHLEPERRMVSKAPKTVVTARVFTKLFSHLSMNNCKEKGNSIDWTSEYPDGLSKVPVMRKNECDGIT